MRDLLANYRLIIRGKTTDSDSDQDPLMSSSSSSTGYGSSAEATIFKQDTSESEDETIRVTRPRDVEYGIESAPVSTLFPSNVPLHENTYDKLQYSNFDDFLYAREDMLSAQKGMLTNSQETLDEKNKRSTHSSLVTIFSVWNTTMGSSLLAMAWGIEKSGLIPGILINIIIAGICLYTAYILLDINKKHGIIEEHFEVPDLCRLLLGRWAEVLAKTFSLVVLIGANIVYWVLMSNFLYNGVYFLHNIVTNSSTDSTSTSTVTCPKEQFVFNSSFNQQITEDITTFNRVWDLYSTVPVILAIIMFPLLNFKSPTFFTKFNSLGTISVGYLLVFTAVKSVNWGVNIQDWTKEFQIKPYFFILSGMLSLSYFIHNIIISIMRHNKNQKNNGRDLVIAFFLVTFTYLFIGVAFYVSFPLAKSCIEDNILNNFSKRDVMTIIARVLLLFQLLTVFPLISFMLRSEIFANLSMMFQNKNYGHFSYSRVIIINSLVVFVCVMFACFLPKIGTLIRYTGALSGMVYIFLLPNLLKIASLRKEGQLTILKMVFHALIILLGVTNLISQFFI